MLNMGGTYPFQIDGNFGTVAAVVEALVWAHERVMVVGGASSGVGGPVNATDLVMAETGDVEGVVTVLRLLPSLSQMWAENGGGSVQGLRAKGGFVVDTAWDGDGKLTEATVVSTLGGEVILTVGGARIGGGGDQATAKEIEVDGVEGSGVFVRLSTEIGGVYHVKMAEQGK
jgi:alpha-L-fucosidase 2